MPVILPEKSACDMEKNLIDTHRVNHLQYVEKNQVYL